MKRIIIINGPNLNLTGQREPIIYGHHTMEDLLHNLHQHFTDIQLDYYQSNVEGLLIDKIQSVGFDYDGIVLNAGGYSHTSVAIHDAIAAITAPTIEVHISNIYAREIFRHTDIISSACRGMICGLGLSGYRYAIEALLSGETT